MKQEENVCMGEASKAEHSASAEKQKGSAALGKFRSVNALEEAYNCLQAEFTRRSQRLKELEKQAENSAKNGGGTTEEKRTGTFADNSPNQERGAESEAAIPPCQPVCERLGGSGTNTVLDGSVSTLETEKSEETQFQTHTRRMIGENAERTKEPALPHPQSETMQPLQATTLDRAADRKNDFQRNLSEQQYESDGTGEKLETNETLGTGEKGNKESGADKLSEEELYRAAENNQAVRRRIVGDYLYSLKNSGAPLMRGGTGTLSAPPVKPTSISDAGELALRYFKKDER